MATKVPFGAGDYLIFRPKGRWVDFTQCDYGGLKNCPDSFGFKVSDELGLSRIDFPPISDTNSARFQIFLFISIKHAASWSYWTKIYKKTEITPVIIRANSVSVGLKSFKQDSFDGEFHKLSNSFSEFFLTEFFIKL